MDINQAMGKVSVAENGCWEWQGSLDRYGYGRIWVNQKWVIAHRYFFKAHKGHLPSCLDHLCRNRACVNPDHLEPVTNKVNVLRGENFAAKNARKTHCKNGHPYSKENTWFRKTGARVCRECDRNRHKKNKANAEATA